MKKQISFLVISISLTFANFSFAGNKYGKEFGYTPTQCNKTTSIKLNDGNTNPGIGTRAASLSKTALKNNLKSTAGQDSQGNQ